MNKKFFIVVSFLLVLLSACQAMGPRNQIEIIRGYEGQLAYVEALMENPNADLRTLYNEEVVDPYYRKCVTGGEYISEDDVPLQPIRDLEQLASAIHKLEALNVDEIVGTAVERSAQQLPGSDTLVCIFVLDPKIVSARELMNGVSGFSPGSGKILLFLYPEENWEAVTEYTTAHEYYHSVWTEKYYDAENQFDLLDQIISEGRAEAFAHTIYPDVEILWLERLSPDQEENVWRMMQPYLDEKSYQQIERFMFGDNTIPKWAGYKIGYQIVQAYLSRHPGEKVTDWISLDAQELLAASGYNE